MRRLILLCLAALACLAGCNAAGHVPPQGLRPAMGVDHSTAEALVSSMQRAMAGGDYAALAECMDPDAREQFQEVLDRSKAYTDRVEQSVALIHGKIGDRQANAFRENVFRGMLTSPLGDAAKGSKINWQRVKIHQDKDIASVTSNSDLGKSFDLVEKDGKWYLASSYCHAWRDEAFTKGTADLEMLDQYIRDGAIDKKNWDRRVAGKGRGK